MQCIACTVARWQGFGFHTGGLSAVTHTSQTLRAQGGLIVLRANTRFVTGLPNLLIVHVIEVGW